ncbi:MAG: hypothetical protein E6I51_03170 [Chloroflexi bacterium]|nr:MAG: hypothetical protein E6I51_03170 [Chloroflexota bacterium]
MSLLMRDGRIAYLGPSDGAPDATDADTIDASGATIVPGLVDCHAHFTGQGGANWLARFGDPEAELLSRGDDASRALARMGILTARDVGAPHRLNLRIRDRVRGRTDAPEILAAGTWLARRDKFPPFVVFVDSGDELRDAAVAEMDAGADLVKIAADTGRTGDEVTFTADELTPTVEAVHARGSASRLTRRERAQRSRSPPASIRSSTALASTRRPRHAWPAGLRSFRRSACSKASSASPRRMAAASPSRSTRARRFASRPSVPCARRKPPACASRREATSEADRSALVISPGRSRCSSAPDSSPTRHSRPRPGSVGSCSAYATRATSR